MNRVVLGCLIVGLLAAAGAAGLYWLVLREGPTFEVNAQATEAVALGAVAELVVEARNPHEKTITLDSIDIDDTLLAGFEVIGVEPAAKDQKIVPFLHQQSWTYRQKVAAGESRQFIFRLKATVAGSFTGTVGVCNTQQDCPVQQIDIVVEAAPAGEPPPAEAPEKPERPAADGSGKIDRRRL
jgi:hypothetical protein